MSASRMQAQYEEHQERPRVAILTCPRCGQVNRMAAESYDWWTEGMLCGLCDPPYPLMRARLTTA